MEKESQVHRASPEAHVEVSALLSVLEKINLLWISSHHYPQKVDITSNIASSSDALQN